MQAAGLNLAAWAITGARRNVGGTVWQGGTLTVAVLGVGPRDDIESAAIAVLGESTRRRGPWTLTALPNSGTTVSVRLAGPGGPIANEPDLVRRSAAERGPTSSPAPTAIATFSPPDAAAGTTVRATATGPGRTLEYAAAGLATRRRRRCAGAARGGDPAAGRTDHDHDDHRRPRPRRRLRRPRRRATTTTSSTTSLPPTSTSPTSTSTSTTSTTSTSTSTTTPRRPPSATDAPHDLDDHDDDRGGSPADPTPRHRPRHRHDHDEHHLAEHHDDGAGRRRQCRRSPRHRAVAPAPPDIPATGSSSRMVVRIGALLFALGSIATYVAAGIAAEPGPRRRPRRPRPLSHSLLGLRRSAGTVPPWPTHGSHSTDTRTKGRDAVRRRRVAHGGVRRSTDPGDPHVGRPGRRARHVVDRSGVGVVPVRRRARRDVRSGADLRARPGARPRGAREERARAPRADREPPPHADRRSELRVLQRGPRAHRRHRRGVHLGRAAHRRCGVHQALRRQRHRVRAHVDLVGGRRDDAARGLSRAVRGRRRGRSPRRS